MSQDPSKFVTFNYEYRGTKIIRRMKIYYDPKVFAKKADEKVLENLIELMQADAERFVQIIDRSGQEEIESTYRNGARYIVKRYMTPALYITQ